MVLHLFHQPVLVANLLDELKLLLAPVLVFFLIEQVGLHRTVVDYINQLLLMEASYLLRQTSLSVAQIAEQLHFAETTTFARFFQRMKGMTPREFRKEK